MRAVVSYEMRVLAPVAPGDEDTRVLNNLPAMLRSVEEDLGDLLPEGWTIRIEEME
jgi:hypothetical protein